MAVTANDILSALKAYSDDKIWASELAFLGGKRRIDFWTLEPIMSKGFRASSYEIKVSRADYARDSLQKQEEAIRYCDRFWYVTPPGIIKRDELPDWAGLQTWDGQKFSVVRKAPRLAKSDPTWELIVSLLRNSGDCRRDVGLMKSQIAHLQYQVDQSARDKKLRNDRVMNKLLARYNVQEAS